MLLQKGLGLSFGVGAVVLLLSGCASSIFPDFADDTQVIIDDGGKVEVRKIDNKGIVVADKENAVYDDEDNSSVFIQDKTVVDEVTPAATVKVETQNLAPVEKNNDTMLADKGMNEAKEVVKATVEEKKDTDSTVVDNKEENTEVVAVEKNEVDVIDELPSMHYLAETVYFDNGSAVVDYNFYKALKNIAQIAKKNNAVVSVYGYASSRTRNTDPATHKLANFKISAQRADNVVALLQKFGVLGENIISHALSDSVPLYQEVMPEGERLNRRVEVYLTY